MQTKLTYREAGRSLVQLQQLEASGKLPSTPTITGGFTTNIGFKKCVARNIAIGIAHSKQPLEIIRWLRDGEYLIDYGMICTTAAKNENTYLLQELCSCMDDHPCLCPVYLLNWFSGRRSLKITDAVRQWLVDRKKQLDDRNAHITNKYITNKYITNKYITYHEDVLDAGSDNISWSDDDKWYRDIGYYYGRYRGVVFYD